MNTIELRTPGGLSVNVPVAPEDDHTPHFALDDTGAARAYYRENGFVVVSGVVQGEDCDVMRALWEAEVKPYRGKIYRQETTMLERHRFNGRGWVMNPILNIQSIDPRRFARTRVHARQRILAAPGLTALFTAILGGRPKIIQSMYFEGNSATAEHRDTDYLDSEVKGTMCAGWIALEDIFPSAGRFFVYPRSHLGEGGSAVAPALRKGDVLFWNSRTAHGSIASQDPDHSRSSITCHAICERHRMTQFRTRVLDPQGERVGGVTITAPKDLARLKNRVARTVEAVAPQPFYALKRIAIGRLVGNDRHLIP